MLSVMSELGYQAIGIGQSDRLAGGEQLYDSAKKYNIAVLDTNPFASPKTVPFVVKNVGGVKVGILSFGFVPLDQDPNDFVFRKALYATFKQARESCDILVLLDQANRVNADWINRNAARLGAPDVVIGGAMRGGLAQDEIVGKTYLVPTTIQAKQVGVVDITIAANGERKIVSKRVQLDDSVKPDDLITKRIDEFVRAGQPVQAQNPAPPPPNPLAPISAQEHGRVQAGQRTYYSPTQCKACHIKEYQDWAASPHAKAVKTLSDANRVVAECLPCHSEEYRRVQKVTVAQDGIGGVDCATCHFEALPHGLERKAVAKRTTVSAVLCVNCHTKDRSPTYDEQAYFPRVVHKQSQLVGSTAVPIH